jgi:hypothetical protein
MSMKRAARRRIARLALGCLTAYGCGRTELDATNDWGLAGSPPTGEATQGQGGLSNTAWLGGTSAVPSSTKATGGLLTGGHVATGGTTTSNSTKATGGLATGGKAAAGGTTMSNSTEATGGLGSGGYIASGGATTALGGSIAVGGSLSTGGTTYWRRTITSNRADYDCPTTSPSTLDPCSCDELPCYCNYGYDSSNGPGNCTEPGTVCVFSSGFGFGCFGGVWRVMGGGVGSGCVCVDPNKYFGTGGTSGSGGTGAAGTSAGTSAGGTSNTSTVTTLGGATSIGGTASFVAPTVVSTGGSYSCPLTEPYQPQAACECIDPPCECDYAYSWTQESFCGDSGTCTASQSYDYTCDGGSWAWQRSGTNYDGCECVTDAGS